jgi:hypothetical protein
VDKCRCGTHTDDLVQRCVSVCVRFVPTRGLQAEALLSEYRPGDQMQVGRCRRVTHIWSRDMCLCVFGLCRIRTFRDEVLISEYRPGDQWGRSCNGNPLVDERTGARHADVRLGGLWNRHGL